MMTLVQCAVCGQLHNPMDPAVHYRSLKPDGQPDAPGGMKWQCADERACHGRAIARTTDLDRRRMFRALDAAWAALEKNGWRI